MIKEKESLTTMIHDMKKKIEESNCFIHLSAFKIIIQDFYSQISKHLLEKDQEKEFSAWFCEETATLYNKTNQKLKIFNGRDKKGNITIGCQCREKNGND